MRWVVLSAVLTAGCLSRANQHLYDDTWRATSDARASAAPAPRSEPAPLEPTRPVTREELVALALAHDPQLDAVRHRVRAALHGARADGSLPPPELNGQIWNVPLEAPYRFDEANMYMVEVRQALPAAGSLDARAHASLLDAQAQLAELVSRRAEVLSRVENAYADYVEAHEMHALREAQLALLDAMREVMRARMTSGAATVADWSRVDLESARQRRELARADGDIERARAVLNASIDRPIDAPLGPPADTNDAVLSLSLADLERRALAARGTLQAARARTDAAAARADAATREARWPSFMLGVSYWQMPSDRPGLGTMVSMTLPWLTPLMHARAEQAAEDAAAERSANDAAVRDATREVGAAYAMVVSRMREFDVIERVELPAASQAFDAVRANYVAGGASLLDWVDATRELLDARMSGIGARASVARAIADLEMAVGAPIPRGVRAVDGGAR